MPPVVRERKRFSVRSYLAAWSSPTNLSKRASLTSLAASLDYVAGITVQFVINPLLVAGLGTYLYGAWRVLYSLNGYLWATSGRSAQALTWVIAHGQRRLTRDEKRRAVGSAVVVWFLFLPLLALVGLVGSWFAPHFLKAPAPYVWPVRVAAALLTADALALSLLSIPRSALQGENLGYKRMGLSAVLILLSGAFTAAAVYAHAGIVGVALANVAGTIVTGLLFWRVARRYVPWFGSSRPQRPEVRRMLGLSAWFTGWKFVYELLTAGDVVVLGFFGSVALVTVYTLTKFVTQAVVPLIGTLFEGTSPGLGAIIGSGDHRAAARIRGEVMTFTWVLCTVLGASLLLWNRSFVALWVGARFYAGAVPMLLIVLMVMQFVFIGNDARIIDLTLKLRGKVLVGATSALLSVVLGALLVSRVENEIVGMLLGVIAGRLILTLGYPLLIGRMLGHPLVRQLRGVPRPALTTVVVFAVTMRIGQDATAGTWPALIAYGIGTAATIALAVSFLGLTRAQRAAILKRLRRILHKPGREQQAGTSNGRVDG